MSTSRHIEQPFSKFNGGVSKMARMSDDLLIESYVEAKRLGLSPEFIELLEKEIQRRSLSI
jgi:developmental checkpoint coupling sporulation initiation to replication initiation